MAGLLGRTIASGDAIQSVAVVVTNAEATYLLKRPRDFAPGEIAELVALAEAGDYVALYRRSRVLLHPGRTTAPLEAPFNLDVNRWSLYDPAATYFLPLNELTLLYLNGVLEILGETTGAFIVDERARFRPAGLARFARSRGGHLHDDPREGRLLTIRDLESLVTEFATIEQGMVIKNLGLMVQALGLGGFPHWAAHPYGWLRALGFRMEELPASRYLGFSRPLRWASRLLGRDVGVPLALGLEREGRPLLAPYRPPYHASMEAAVRAVVELKFGPEGVFRAGTRGSAWREPARIAAAAPAPSAAAVDATIAYATYVWERYGRFPAYSPPFRTVLGFQANHVDVDFYERFYRPEALAARAPRPLARRPVDRRAAVMMEPASGSASESVQIQRGSGVLRGILGEPLARWPACSPRSLPEPRCSALPRGGRCGSGSRAACRRAPGRRSPGAHRSSDRRGESSSCPRSRRRRRPPRGRARRGPRYAGRATTRRSSTRPPSRRRPP